MRCGAPLPLPPASTVGDIKKKFVRAISALPTSERVTTSYNHTRAPGPAGVRQVTYLLPRQEPAGELSSIAVTGQGLPGDRLCCQFPPSSTMREIAPIGVSDTDTSTPGDPNPVLWVDMRGNQVEQCSAWDIWTAAVALNTICVQNGRTGLAYNLGESLPVEA